MFRASSCPSSGATTAVAVSGLPSELGDSSAVGRGRVGYTGPTTNNSTAITKVGYTGPTTTNSTAITNHQTVNQRLLLQLL